MAADGSAWLRGSTLPRSRRRETKNLALRWRRTRAADPTDFDHFADVYDRRDELTNGWVTPWLEEQLRGRSGASAIDLGCGNGRTAVLLANHYQQVRAVDLSGEMIRLAQSRRPHPRVTFERADIDEVDGQYDLVLSIMVLHHVPDLERTLDRIRRMVAPGGVAILVDNAEPQRTRAHFHWGHLMVLYGELRAGRPHAFERFLLNSDRRWMDHLVSDRFLTVEQFRTIYPRALPGAVIGTVNGLSSAVWERPSSSD